jgi:hypothetical protein
MLLAVTHLLAGQHTLLHTLICGIQCNEEIERSRNDKEWKTIVTGHWVS